MSVINEMLRDLDKGRRGDGPMPPMGGGGGVRRRSGWVAGLLLAAVVLLAAGAGWWYLGLGASLSASIGRMAGMDGSDGGAVPAGSTAGGEAAGSAPAPAASGPVTGYAESRPTAPEPAPASVLSGVSLTTEGEESRLVLELTGPAPASTDHQRDGRDGRIRLTGVELAPDLTVPAVPGEALESLVVLPSGNGAEVRYRTVTGATTGFEGGVASDDDPARAILRVTAPSPVTANGTDADGDAPRRDVPSSDSLAGREDATAAAANRATDAGDAESEPPAAAGDNGPSTAAGDDAGEGSEAESSVAAGTTTRSTADGAATGDGDAEAGAGSFRRERRPPSPAERAESAYEKALDALRRGDDNAAGEALERALDLDAGHTGARRALAMMMLRDGRAREAGSLLRRGLREGARTPELITLYARSWLERGQLERAVSIMEQGRREISPGADYLATLAALYQRQSRYEEAAGAYRAALSRRSDVGQWLAGLGIALENTNRPSPARRAYQRAQRTGGMGSALANYVAQRIRALE